MIRISAVVTAVYTLTLVLSSAALAQPEPAMPMLSDADMARLEAGEILLNLEGDQDLPTGDAIVLLDLPADRLLDAIREPESESDAAEAEIIRVEGEYTYVRMEVDTPWPMTNRHFVLRQRYGSKAFGDVEALWLDWDYVPDSGNLVDTEGYWLLVPYGPDGQRTLTRYHIIVDLGSWIPDFAMSWAMENALPGTIRGIANQAAAAAEAVARSTTESPL